MCWWGQALSLGPNINAPMDPSDAAVVYKAVRRAQVNAANASELEQGLINAIAQRYVAEAPADRSPLDRAYADAMRALQNKFPDVDEVTTLTSEALMDLHPWDYWLRDGKPQPWTPEILALMEKVMTRSPRHPGANHLYIHINEASSNPGKATPSADLLRDLVPGSGHLVHMPSHIYIRTGRYADGIAANEKAVLADEDYISTCRAQGIYPLSYYPHNYHFYWACAQMSGRGQLALEVSRKLVSKLAKEKMGDADWAALQHYYVTPWLSMVRFDQWDQLSQEERPADSLRYSLAIWNYAQGIASVRNNKAKEAQQYLQEIKSIQEDPLLANQRIWGINSFADVVNIAALVLEGEILSATGKYSEAVTVLEKARASEDGLLYQEPPDWYYPVRETLGNVLLKAARFGEAEKVFREDLVMYPENGWSLGGLYRALKAQKKDREAEQVRIRFEKAFKDADEYLRGSGGLLALN
jgi:tetratricopeptide (TPR) repeat protein